MDKELDEIMEERTLRRIADSKAALKPRRARKAPIQKLPFEVLSEIFILCGGAERLAPVIIATVSRQWRMTILSTPRAWNHIIVEEYGSHEALSSYASVYLTRSHSCLLHVDVRPNHGPYECGEEECTCTEYPEAIQIVLNAAHRILCLKIDHQWAHELEGKSFPQLKHFVLSQEHHYPYSFSLDISRFEALLYLELPIFMWADQLDITRLNHLQIRYLSICASEKGKWLPILEQCGRTLHTLKLTIVAHMRAPLQSKLDLPILESLTISDDSNCYDAIPGVLELKTPRLRFYSYKAHLPSIRVDLLCEMSQFVQLRTDFLIRFANYPHLRILQLRLINSSVEYKFEDVLKQLEANPEVTSRLHTIEFRMWDGMYQLRKLLSDRIPRLRPNVMFTNREWYFKEPIYEHACDGGMLCAVTFR